MKNLSEKLPPAGRIRLAFVIDIITAWHLGGTEKQLAQLVRTLDRRFFEPVIFILQATPGVLETQVGCPVVLVNSSSNMRRIRSLRNLRAALRDFDPHIVQTFFIDGLFYGTVAAWLNRVPVIVNSRRNAGHWQKPYHTVGLRVINLLAHSFQCNSRCVADALHLSEGVPQDRISILPNSIDLNRFSPVTQSERLAIRLRVGLPLDAPVFVIVANLRPVKGLITIIETAARIRSRMPNALFLLVGEGPQRDELAEQIQLRSLSDTVRLIGAQEDVRPWLSVADLGILPSHSESSSNALLEYMATGLPTVVSDIPANRELVQGEFFAPGNSAELADCLLRLGKEPRLREEMSRRNREAVIPYGEDSVSERAQNYYLGLAAKFPKAATKGQRLEA